MFYIRLHKMLSLGFPFASTRLTFYWVFGEQKLYAMNVWGLGWWSQSWLINTKTPPDLVHCMLGIGWLIRFSHWAKKYHMLVYTRLSQYFLITKA